jgi:hypothetical protein
MEAFKVTLSLKKNWYAEKFEEQTWTIPTKKSTSVSSLVKCLKCNILRLKAIAFRKRKLHA